ncbi:MAG: hypothetical protein K2J71_10350 [Oscillospiraceae bacterium]|nr:hypothetical protein [Oscillospiraceae bacterium]
MPNSENSANPAMITSSLDQKELLAIVAQRCPGAEFRNDSLHYPALDLHVRLAFGSMNQVENRFSVQLIFILQHPWFDENLIESCAGLGHNPEEAMKNGTESFCDGVLQFVISALQENYSENFENSEILRAELMGQIHDFYIPAERPVLHRGVSSRSTDLWEIIKSQIPAYLGTKRCYWIKLYSARIHDTPVCEVRINNTLYPDLTDLLMKEAFQNPEIRMDKQFLLLIQKEDTFQPCPFEKQDVGQLTFMALDKMRMIKDPASHQKIFHEIQTICPDYSIAVELISFLPEICAQMILEFRDNDSLIPVINYGKPKFELKKSQVRSYSYMEDAVEQYLRKIQPSQEDILNIVRISARFEVLTKALHDNVPVENLRMSQLVYFVNENYHVW